jgi:hypothetical protein
MNDVNSYSQDRHVESPRHSALESFAVLHAQRDAEDFIKFRFTLLFPKVIQFKIPYPKLTAPNFALMIAFHENKNATYL